SLITFATYANTVQVGNWDVYSRNEYQQLIAQSEPDYYKLGMLFLAHDDLAVAFEYFEKTSHQDKLFYQAYARYKQLRLSEALDLIEKYLLKNKNTSAYSLYIDIVTDLGFLDKLENLFNDINKNNIANSILLYKQGMYYLSSNHCNKAISSFEKVLELSPSSTIVYKPLSSAYRSCNQPKLAKKYRKKDYSETIIDNDPLLVRLYEYGNPAFFLKPKLQKLITAKKYSKALAVAESLLKIQTNDENIWINYGSLLVKNNKSTEAIAAYKQAFALNNKNEMTLQNLIKIYWGQDKNKAIHWLDILLKLNPKHFTALRVKGDYYKLQQKPALALEYYHQALQQEPEHTYILKNIAILYIETNNISQAINTLDKAFRIAGNNITIANYLARTLIIANNKESLARALRISRTIYKLRADYTNKFALLMALRANKLDAEADILLGEIKLIPLKESQNKFKQQLEYLQNYTDFIKHLDSQWVW
ncbi:hypothetical protein MNBD_GAMMA01-2011, partial [hydrothermal vent metagenome]